MPPIVTKIGRRGHPWGLCHEKTIDLGQKTRKRKLYGLENIGKFKGVLFIHLGRCKIDKRALFNSFIQTERLVFRSLSDK